MPIGKTSESVQVVLPTELVDRLREVAKSRGIGLSTLLRMFCYACLERPQ